MFFSYLSFDILQFFNRMLDLLASIFNSVCTFVNQRLMCICRKQSRRYWTRRGGRASTAPAARARRRSFPARPRSDPPRYAKPRTRSPSLPRSPELRPCSAARRPKRTRRTSTRPTRCLEATTPVCSGRRPRYKTASSRWRLAPGVRAAVPGEERPPLRRRRRTLASANCLRVTTAAAWTPPTGWELSSVITGKGRLVIGRIPSLRTLTLVLIQSPVRKFIHYLFSFFSFFPSFFPFFSFFFFFFSSLPPICFTNCVPIT